MNILPYNDVRVTGGITAGVEDGEPRHVVDLTGIVATVSADGYVKVWPTGVWESRYQGGKLWFNTQDPDTKIIVVPDRTGEICR